MHNNYAPHVNIFLQIKRGGLQLLILTTLLCYPLPLFAGESAPAQITSQIAHDLQSKNEAGLVFIDVRSPQAFHQGHIPDALNVPLAEIGKPTISKESMVVLYCGGLSCSKSEIAAKKLLSQGYDNVRVLKGGLNAWKQRDYPVEPKSASKRVQSISSKELLKEIDKKVMGILDVRPVKEYLAGHLPGAVNVPLENLPAMLGVLLKKAEWVVYDRVPNRAQKAAFLIVEKGLKATKLEGGIAVWAKRGYPIEVGPAVREKDE